jgi:phage terminase large subunit
MKIELKHTRVFHSLWSEQKRINCFRGGARSSKTWSILQAIAIYLVSGQFGDRSFPVGNFAVVRETLPALRASAYKDFIEILHQMNFYHKVDHRKTVLEFHYQKRSVDFFSTDDLIVLS